MRFEEFEPNLPNVNPSARPQTSRNRDRALARVQSLTARTAVAATIATAGFGGLAAFTYSGTSGATGVDTTTPAGANVDGTTTNTTDTTTPNTTISGLQAAPAPTAKTHHTARVTSGGSGH
jgi:hypothetical protein